MLVGSLWSLFLLSVGEMPILQDHNIFPLKQALEVIRVVVEVEGEQLACLFMDYYTN